MITISFEASNVDFDVDSPESIDPAIIGETVFEAPIYLMVEGVNVLGFQSGMTTYMSLIGFASSGIIVIKRLKPGGTEQIPIASSGWLYFSEKDGKVSFWTTTFRPNVKAGYAETVAAFEAFAKEVAELIIARFPKMKDNPVWHPWLPREL